MMKIKLINWRKVKFLLLFIPAGFFLISNVKAQNLITNPGFESGSSSHLWGGSSVVSSNQHSGTYAAQLTHDSQWGGGYEEDISGLTPSTTYTFSAWVKSSGGVGLVGVKSYGGVETNEQVTSTGYQNISVTFTTGPASTSARVYVYNPVDGPTYLYADDLLLEESETSQFNLIFSDEFNGSGSFDTTKWKAERGFKRNNEAQYYLPDNIVQKDGNLVIYAKRDTVLNENYDPNSGDWKKNREYGYWTSGSLATFDGFNFLYGRVECRAKVSNLTGTWPAIWTVGTGTCSDWPSGGEIDIMENYQGKILANYAVAASDRWRASWDSYSIPVGDISSNFADEYHIWTLDWTANKMAIYVDGILLNEFDPNTQNSSSSYSCPGIAPFKTAPQLLWLDLALGGNNGGSTAGLPDSTVYLVDYIRVYQMDSTSNGNGSGDPLYYNLENRGSSKYIDVSSASSNDGANILQWTPNGGQNQQWQLEDVGSGYYHLIARHSSKCMTVANGSASDGANIEQSTCDDTYWRQQFSLIDLENGYYQIQNRNSGKCISVQNGSTSDGANIEQLTCDNSYWRQQFALANGSSSARTGVSASNVRPGMSTELTGDEVILYPNPVSDVVNINWSGPFDAEGQMAVYDTFGRLILRKELVKDNLSLDVSHFTQGVYIVKILVDGKEQISRKFIKPD